MALEELRRITIELLARGRTGSALMRALLAVRGAGYIPPASGLEADFLALLVAAGPELPEGQVNLGAEGWIGRVDFFGVLRITESQLRDRPGEVVATVRAAAARTAARAVLPVPVATSSTSKPATPTRSIKEVPASANKSPTLA
jgi:hypothetical protein